jgi:hypothetical protein
VQPPIGPGLKDEKWFVQITGPGYDQPGYVGYGGFQPGFGGGFQAGFGGGYGRPGNGVGYGYGGYGYGVGGINGGRGGFRGGNGIPGY